jgi:hypothetical protein
LRHHVGSCVKEDGIHSLALKRNAWGEDGKNDEEADDEQEDEEEKAVECKQPTTATASAVNLTEGTVEDLKVFPAMNAFNVPGNNVQALAQLHKEVTPWRVQQLQIKSSQEPACKGSVLCDDGKHMKLFVENPQGDSKQTFIKLRNVVVWIIKHCANDDVESLQGLSTEVITGLKLSFKEAFLDVAKDKGCSASQAGVMSAERWTAMAEAANLRTTQQTIISRFLFHHFGHDHLEVSLPSLWASNCGSATATSRTWTKVCRV